MKPHRVKRVEPHCRSSRGIQPVADRRLGCRRTSASSRSPPRGVGGRRWPGASSSRGSTGALAPVVEGHDRFLRRQSGVGSVGRRTSGWLRPPRGFAPILMDTRLGTEDASWPTLSGRGCSRSSLLVRRRPRVGVAPTTESGRALASPRRVVLVSVADQVGTPPDPS